MTHEPDSSKSEATSVPEAQHSQETTPEKEASFGWNAYAERINGRFAMIGFVALLMLEFFTHQDFFTWLGLR
jgi:hypothetical protein